MNDKWKYGYQNQKKKADDAIGNRGTGFGETVLQWCYYIFCHVASFGIVMIFYYYKGFYN